MFNGRCPKCLVPPNKLREYTHYPPWDHAEVINAYHLADKDMKAFHVACCSTGIKPVYHPFCPLTDIYISVTPDILH